MQVNYTRDHASAVVDTISVYRHVRVAALPSRQQLTYIKLGPLHGEVRSRTVAAEVAPAGSVAATEGWA